jgi:hypothetical protein
MTKTGWVLKLGDRPAEERNGEGVDDLGARTVDRYFPGGNFMLLSHGVADKCGKGRVEG